MFFEAVKGILYAKKFFEFLDNKAETSGGEIFFSPMGGAIFVNHNGITQSNAV